MIKLGIIGHPIGHTLSPVMHKAVLDHLGIEGDYLILDTPAEDLVEQLKYLKINNFRGFNITIPLKIWITPLLNDVDDYANVVGAVNTVIIRENKDLSGFNTDVYGFVQAIPAEIKTSLESKKAAVLGAGGAARAVAAGLAELGLDEITFYSRNLEKSLKIKEMMLANFPETIVKLKDYNEYANLEDASILINTTPLGMAGENIALSPVTKRSIESLPDNAVIYDLVYNPRETQLIKFARQQDLQIVEGLDMLVYQGAKALSLWIEQDIPVEIMKEAVIKNL